jgi:hypothetical protein
MGTGKLLMLSSERLARVAVSTQFFLPAGTDLALHLTHRYVGLPLRWVVPLLLISIAGALSAAALFNMYWRLAHVPLSVSQ